jgi:NitT/TauT family transport system substrate-binding protein
MKLLPLLTLVLLIGVTACDSKKGDDGPPRLRVGHFPNITHAQGVIANELTRQGKGWFEERLPGVKIEWFTYNAGPSAMEAIFTDSVDLTYVGTGPLLNAYTRAKGAEIRLVAGSAVGGAALVVQGDGGLAKLEDFRGKKIAVPALGNTQDIACRVWLKKGGFNVTQLGGDAQIIPTENPEQLGLFAGKKIDAVWTVEPWVSRLEMEGKGRILLEEKEAITTVLAAGVKALQNKNELVTKFVKAHAELTEWINQHPAEAKALFLAGMKSITRRDLSPEMVEHAWPRLTFTSHIDEAAIQKLVTDSQSVGYLKDAPKLGPLMALPK